MKGIFVDFRFQEDDEALVRMTMSEVHPRAEWGGSILSLELIPEDCTGSEAFLSIVDSSNTQSWPPLGGFWPTTSCRYLSLVCSLTIDCTIDDGGRVLPSRKLSWTVVSRF